MLEQITWQQFLLAAGLLSLGWYAWLVLSKGLAFRPGLTTARPYPGEHSPDQNFQTAGPARPQEEPDTLEDGLIGRPRLPEGLVKVSTSSLSFAGTATSTGPGLVNDLTEDLKEIFTVLAKEDGQKKDFFRMIASVKENYDGLAGHPGIKLINDFLLENAPFLISPQELEALWD